MRMNKETKTNNKYLNTTDLEVISTLVDARTVLLPANTCRPKTRSGERRKSEQRNGSTISERLISHARKAFTFISIKLLRATSRLLQNGLFPRALGALRGPRRSTESAGWGDTLPPRSPTGCLPDCLPDCPTTACNVLRASGSTLSLRTCFRKHAVIRTVLRKKTSTPEIGPPALRAAPQPV